MDSPKSIGRFEAICVHAAVLRAAATMESQLLSDVDHPPRRDGPSLHSVGDYARTTMVRPHPHVDAYIDFISSLCLADAQRLVTIMYIGRGDADEDVETFPIMWRYIVSMHDEFAGHQLRKSVAHKYIAEGLNKARRLGVDIEGSWTS